MYYKKITFKKFLYLILILCLVFTGFSTYIRLHSPPNTKKVKCTPSSVSANTIIEDLQKNSPNKQHPRLLIKSQDFKRIKAQLNNDKNLMRWYKSLENESNKIILEPTVKYELPDGLRLLEVSQRVLNRIIILSLMYRLNGDEKYAERAWAELSTVSNNRKFPNWNPKHFLDTAEMTTAVAIGYDWLYDYLSFDQKKILREAIINKGLNPALKVYQGTANNNQISNYWKDIENNWNTVSNAGIALGALAIADESTKMEKLTGEIIGSSIASIKKSVAQYAPDGGLAEGPGYWNYATIYLTYFLSSLDSALGSDYCLSEMKGLKDTGYYPIYVEGPAGTFNVGDGSSQPIMNTPQLFWLSQKYKKHEFSDFSLRGNSPLNLIWYRSDRREVSKLQELPLDKSFVRNNTSLMTMRSSWNKDAIFIGLHGGDNQASHGDLDIGSFVLDALGVRWAIELGSDNYNLPGYFDMSSQRWNYYRKRSEGQNTLVINPGLGPDQNIKGKVNIEKIFSSPTQAYSVINMTNAYKNNAILIKRGMALVCSRSAVILQDELQLKGSSKVYWFMHSTADIEISNDKKTAILTNGNKRVFAHISSPKEGEFSIMTATPLATSPHPNGQLQNGGIKKLSIVLNAVNKTKISVSFIPDINNNRELPKEWPNPGKLDTWGKAHILTN
ncbi:heparinase II/III family protein [Priestia aryabhattai]|uniref:heparinase II/III domain-containing protein n=1 Tax=Priestia aryabhattai TaxID=412384 RepID=UPI003D2BD88D